jgi:hypothetical protein
MSLSGGKRLKHLFEGLETAFTRTDADNRKSRIGEGFGGNELQNGHLRNGSIPQPVPSDERGKVGFAAKRMLDRAVELLRLRRLQNERGCPEAYRRRSNLLFIGRADENDFRFRRGPPDIPAEIQSVGAGHQDVENDHVWFELGCGLEYLAAVRYPSDDVVRQLQPAPPRAHKSRIVINDEDSRPTFPLDILGPRCHLAKRLRKKAVVSVAVGHDARKISTVAGTWTLLKAEAIVEADMINCLLARTGLQLPARNYLRLAALSTS